MAQRPHPLAVDAAESPLIMLTKLRRFGRARPRFIAYLILAGFAVILLLPWVLSGPSNALAGSGIMSLDQMVLAVVWQTILCLILMGLVALLGWHDLAGFAGPIDRAGLRSFYAALLVPAAILMILAVGLMTDGKTASPLRVIMIILSLNAMVGLSEELLFRGILFGALRQKHRLITAIVISSLIFGLIHIVNLGAGQSGSATAYQIFNAALLGAVFCAILLQTNSLWPPIALHMIWNSYVMLGLYSAEHAGTLPDTITTEPSGITADIVILPALLAGITWVILWRYTKRTGVDLWRTQPS